MNLHVKYVLVIGFAYVIIILFVIQVQIAEKLKHMIDDELHKDVEQETRMAFMELFRDTSPFTVSKDTFRDTCSRILKRCHKLFTTGWQKISVVYFGEFQRIIYC